MKLFTQMAGLLVSMSLALATAQAADKNEDDYDRLDGHGKSGKKVNVIEWEGNLEIHVYPAGSLKGLGLKLDKKDKNKPVMVISYRFDSVDSRTPLVRRAILGIPFYEGFHAYQDKTADDYDKIVISNNGLSTSKTLVEYKLDAEPKQLYPDGHPMLAGGEDGKRAPAAKDVQKARNLNREQVEQPKTFDDESGSIKHFEW